MIIFKAVLYEKSLSVKVLVIVIIVFKRYPSACCLVQGIYFSVCYDRTANK